MEYFKEDEIKQYILDNLEYHASNYMKMFEYKGNIDEDLHHNLFNTDYYIIGYYRAEQWLEDKTFECIEVVKEYEEMNFGEVTTDLSNSEQVVNMYVYIVGEHILQDVVRGWLRDECVKAIFDDNKEKRNILFSQLLTY